MKIKIISNGISFDTKVIDIETGKELENITRIHWFIDANSIAKAIIEFSKVEVEIESEFKKDT